MTIFKIRRRSDGLYSSGGNYPKFSTKGKTWNKKGSVALHLAALSPKDLERHYTDCIVVELEVIEKDAASSSVEAFNKVYADKRKIREDKRKEASKIAEIAYLERQAEAIRQRLAQAKK